MILRQHAARDGVTDLPFSVSEISDYRQRNRSLSALVEYHGMTFTLLGGTEPHRVRTGVVSAGFFQFLGVQPVLGRTFAADDEQAGAGPVLILSYEFWKKQERGDPNIIGRKYQMNDRVHTVIGVLPPIPQYPNENDVYMTTTSCPFRGRPAFIANRIARMMRVFGRLKPGVSLDRARADLGSIAGQLEKEYPAAYTAGMGYGITPFVLREELTHEAKPLLWALLGAAAFVLLATLPRAAACLRGGNRPQLHKVSGQPVAPDGGQAAAGTHPAFARRPLRRRIVQLPDGRRQPGGRPGAALPRLRRQPAGD